MYMLSIDEYRFFGYFMEMVIDRISSLVLKTKVDMRKVYLLNVKVWSTKSFKTKKYDMTPQ